MTKYINDILSKYNTIIGVSDDDSITKKGELLGLVSLEYLSKKINIWGLYVFYKFRNYHIGSKIMEYIIDISNKEKLDIELSVSNNDHSIKLRQNHDRLLKFYKKFGFVIIGKKASGSTILKRYYRNKS